MSFAGNAVAPSPNLEKRPTLSLQLLFEHVSSELFRPRSSTRSVRAARLLAILVLAASTGSAGGVAEGALPDDAGGPEVLAIEPRDNWFEVYRILPGVYSIREPGHWERVISYLIVGTKRALLFDTGTGIGDIRQVVSELTKLPVVVTNSHSHSDHIGGNYQFEEIYSLDLETTKRNARGRTVEESWRLVQPRAFSRRPPADFSRENYRIRPYQVTKYLKAGEIIKLGDRDLEVLLTPGHADDALCLLDRQHRFILTGDTFYLGRLFVESKPSSLEAYTASAARLAALAGAVDRLLPAHSTTLLKPLFLTRLDEAFQAIRRQDRSPSELEEKRVEFSFDGFSIAVSKSIAATK